MDIDRETKQVLDQGKAVKEMLNSEGWKIVQDIINQSILDISSLQGVNSTNPEELIKEVGAKKLASESLITWLTKINNIANQYDSNKNYKHKNEDYIINITPESDRT